MYATKEAVIAKEHQPDLDVHVFMMDMRAFSKGYWSYFERARDQYGVHYHRCRVSELHEDPATHNLLIRYQGDQQSRGDSGHSALSIQHSAISTQEFDLVVLSVGMEISESVRALGKRLGVELDEYGFCHTVQFNPIETSRPGIYAVGPFREPKDIPESVVEASGAAAASAGLLAGARWSLTRTREYAAERDVAHEEPRIGVFVCHCGSNIAGYLDVPAVTEYARALPHVVHAEDKLYACSQDSIKLITERVQEHHLNRVVVASLHAADASALVPGQHPQRRVESVPVRDGEHPQSMLVGALARTGCRHRESAGPRAHVRRARGAASTSTHVHGAGQARGADRRRRRGGHDGGTLVSRAGLSRSLGREGSGARRQSAAGVPAVQRQRAANHPDATG